MFKASLIAIALLAAPAAAIAQPVTVTFSHLTPTQGTLMVGVYISEADYGAGKASGGTMVPVTGDTAQVTIDVPEGDCALKVFHDVNGNGKLDTNPFGMPIEPFAFSNNAKGHMGPATWADAHFAVTATGATQAIAF